MCLCSGKPACVCRRFWGQRAWKQSEEGNKILISAGNHVRARCLRGLCLSALNLGSKLRDGLCRFPGLIHRSLRLLRKLGGGSGKIPAWISGLTRLSARACVRRYAPIRPSELGLDSRRRLALLVQSRVLQTDPLSVPARKRSEARINECR